MYSRSLLFSVYTSNSEFVTWPWVVTWPHIMFKQRFLTSFEGIIEQENLNSLGVSDSWYYKHWIWIVRINKLSPRVFPIFDKSEASLAQDWAFETSSIHHLNPVSNRNSIKLFCFMFYLLPNWKFVSQIWEVQIKILSIQIYPFFPDMSDTLYHF